MLKEVLREIKNSKYISKSNIAKKLNTTENVIEQAFFDLEKLGYIKTDNNKSCNLNCKGCSFASLCNKVPLNTIKITEKGKRLIDK